jgi:hypothetical protein
VKRNLKMGAGVRGWALGGAVASMLMLTGAVHATTVAQNTGSLGAAANGTHADAVTFGQGAVTAGSDLTAVYNGQAGTNTTVPFQSALNPASSSPFSVEFWANSTASDNDDAPVSNRVSAGNRSGWVFFQRGPTANPTGWNFRMYDGVGGNLGWDLTGGTSTLNTWSHVVATWNGTSASLYVNGVLADSSNDAAASGNYNASSAANFIVASSDSGSPFTGGVDEVAFYNSALSPTQISGHYSAISSPTAGAYQSLVRSDGALLQLSNNDVPEPSAIMLLGAGGLVLMRRHR